MGTGVQIPSAYVNISEASCPIYNPSIERQKWDIHTEQAN